MAFKELSMADIASITVAIATLVLAFFTYLSVRQARDAQRATARPVLIPVTSEAARSIGDGQPTSLDIENVGPGVATDIWLVLFPYTESPSNIPPQFSYREHLPLRSNEQRRMPIMQGGTIFSRTAKVGNIPLAVPDEFAPESTGLPNPADRKPRIVSRLTMTCRDSLGLKWCFTYDLDWTDHWISINTGRPMAEDLRDLDAKITPPRSSRRAPPAA